MSRSSIRYGVCCGPEHWDTLRRLGYDYAEFGLAALSAMDGAAYRAALRALPADFRVEAVNGLLPGHIRLCDEQFDPQQCRDYLNAALERAAALGVQIAVFGSGGSRRYVEGYDRASADEQLLEFGRILGDRAAAFHMTAVVEPLRAAECNNLNTVAEAAAYARSVGSPSLCVLADLFHMAEGGEPMRNITEAGPLLRHCHIANPDGRRPPAPGDPYDYAPFFDALHAAGYNGRVSVEGLFDDFEAEAAHALALLRKFQ